MRSIERWGAASRGAAVGSLLAALLAGGLGCGDDGRASGQGGGSGSQEAATGPGGGTGQGGATGAGGAVACPEPTHGDADGACVASLSAFEDAGNLATPRDHHVTFVVESDAGRFLYVHGGAQDMSDFVKTTERAAIAADGTLGPFEVVGPELLLAGHAVAVRGNQVIFYGGQRALGSTTSTFQLEISPDGTLGEPQPAEELLGGHFHVGGAQVGDFVYAVGGIEDRADGSWSTDSVELARFDEQGLAAWQQTTPLPGPRSHHVVTAHGGYLYVAGGLDREGSFTNDTSLPDVIRAPIGEDGALGAWELQGTLPMDLAVAAATTVGDQIWIVGGLVDGAHDHQGPTGELTTFTSAVHRATVAQGQLGPFEIVGQLPQARGHCHQVPIVDGVLYAVGGHGDDGRSQGEAYLARFQ